MNKDYFQTVNIPFPLIVVDSESFQLVEGEKVKIFLFMFSRCSAGLGIGESLLSDQGRWERAQQQEQNPPINLFVSWGLSFLTKPA